MASKTLWVSVRGDISKMKKDLSGVRGVVNSLQREISGALKFGAGALALGGLTIATKKLAGSVRALAEEGDRLADLEQAYTNLGGTASAIKAADAATQGLLTKTQLLTEANKLWVRGAPDINKNLSLVAEYAVRFGQAMGEEAAPSLEKVVAALVKGKPQLLASVGLLDQTTKKAQSVSQSYEVMRTRLATLQPIQLGVADSFQVLDNAMAGAREELGKVIDASPELQQSLESLINTVKGADWESIGTMMAEGLAIGMEALQKIISGLEWIAQHVPKGKTVSDMSYGEWKSHRRGSAADMWSNIFAGTPLPSADDSIKKYQELFHDDSFQKWVDSWDQVGPKVNTFKTNVKGATAETEKLAKEAERVRDAFYKEIDDSLKRNLETSLEGFIELQDFGGFESALGELKDLMRDNIEEGWEEAKKSGVPRETFEQWRDLQIQIASDEYWQKWADEGAARSREVSDQLRQDQEDALRASVDFWQSAFDAAINGTSMSLEQALKDVAVGFASQIMGALTQSIGGALGQMNSPMSFGGTLANMLFGGGASGGSAGGSGGGMLGALGLGGALGSLGGGAGVMLDSGAIIAEGAAIPAGATAVGSAAMPATGALGALGPWGVAAIAGLAILGSSGGLGGLGSLFGGGPKNKETIARNDFAGMMEDLIKEIGGLKIFDEKGKLRTITDFEVGSSDKFNNPDWPKEMDSWGEQAKGTFLALGEALKNVQGITEDVGSQLGFLLGENLLGDLDNARLAVMELGLSFEDLKQGLLDAALKGDISWQEFNVHVANLGEAFKPGLAAVGDLNGALQEIVNSAGRGMPAVKGVLDFVQEAIEAGAKNLEEAKALAIQQGADPKLVETLLAAAAARGIDTLEEWQSMSQETAGSIAGDMASMNEDLKKTWDEMQADIDKLSETLNSLPTDVETTVNVKAIIDPDLKTLLDSGALTNGGTSEPVTDDTEEVATANASGRIINTRTSFLYHGKLNTMAEGGPEAIMPLTRIGGRLGVIAAGGAGGGGTPMVINIDARGAEQGVEMKILRAIKSAESQIIGKTLRIVSNSVRSGGLS